MCKGSKQASRTEACTKLPLQITFAVAIQNAVKSQTYHVCCGHTRCCEVTRILRVLAFEGCCSSTSTHVWTIPFRTFLCFLRSGIPLPSLLAQKRGNNQHAHLVYGSMCILKPRDTCSMLCRRLLAVVLTLSCVSSNSSSTSFLSTLPNRAV